MIYKVIIQIWNDEEKERNMYIHWFSNKKSAIAYAEMQDTFYKKCYKDADWSKEGYTIGVHSYKADELGEYKHNECIEVY